MIQVRNSETTKIQNKDLNMYLLVHGDQLILFYFRPQLHILASTRCLKPTTIHLYVRKLKNLITPSSVISIVSISTSTLPLGPTLTVAFQSSFGFMAEALQLDLMEDSCTDQNFWSGTILF